MTNRCWRELRIDDEKQCLLNPSVIIGENEVGIGINSEMKLFQENASKKITVKARVKRAEIYSKHGLGRRAVRVFKPSKSHQKE